MSHPFADKSIIITGASDGIGAELARQLAAQGAWLSLGARRAHELDLVAQECIARGGRAIVVPTDVSDPHQCQTLVQHSIDSYGKVDALVNNAGIGAIFRFDQVEDLTAFERVMRVNYLGSVYCTHFALPHLVKTRGRLVAVSSLTGKTGVPNRTAYAASKHAMQGFFDSLRIELEDSGVTVTVVSPGFVRTNIRRNAMDAHGEQLGSEPVSANHAIDVDECVREIVQAMAHRTRELVMTSHWKIKAIVQAIAPAVVDRIAKRAVEQSQQP